MAGPLSRVFATFQLVAALVVLTRLSRGRRRRPPLQARPVPLDTRVSVVVPARNEARRIGPCLEGLVREADLHEVIVVDDGSTDGTADLAIRAGAAVVTAEPPPPGWVGKPWALQRGLEAASGEVVVSVDADTRPSPGLVGALVEALADADLVTAGARFACDTAGERWLHPAMLATLVYRFGPQDGYGTRPAERLLVNGQCTAVRRRALLERGGYAHAAGHMTDDAAQARALARLGWRVSFHDGGDLIAVDMHDSVAGTWREWGRSLGLPDVTSPAWKAADVAVVWLTLGLPLPRLLAGRAGTLDRLLIALRAVMSVPLARSYVRRGPAYWLSPLADPLAAARLTWSIARPARRWRDRDYA